MVCTSLVNRNCSGEGKIILIKNIDIFNLDYVKEYPLLVLKIAWDIMMSVLLWVILYAIFIMFFDVQCFLK